MERYWTASLIQLAGWVPEAWHSDLRPRQEWLISRFGAEKKSNYAPISKDLLAIMTNKKIQMRLFQDVGIPPMLPPLGKNITKQARERAQDFLLLTDQTSRRRRHRIWQRNIRPALALAMGMEISSIRNRDGLLGPALDKQPRSDRKHRALIRRQSAVYASLTGGSTASENQITPVCSTGNCTFKVGDPVGSSIVTVNGTTAGDFGGSSGSFSTVAVCSSCVDATSLVKFVRTDDQFEDYISSVYGLPNGLLIDYGGSGTYLNVSTDRNLEWLGDLLTPAHAQAARWAMVNVTLLSFSVAQCGETVTPQCPIPGKTNLAGSDSSAPNKTAGGIAATCALFPCMRRYVPSITNNKLSESQIDNSQLWPSIDYYYASLHLETENALTNSESNYAGIQTPCRVGDSIYTAQNISTAPNATRLWIHETLVDGTLQSRNVSAPEPCIYRHSALFASVLSRLLHQKDTMFNTYCKYDSEEGPDCNLQSGDGMNTWVDTIYNNGNATVSAVEAYFESFAVAMTNRYRSTFGSSQYDRQPRPRQWLPPGEVQGIVWQDTVCTAARWQWLLLPVGLLLLTSSLLSVTVTRGWKHRHVQPVWKANILPTLLYKERFMESNGPMPSRPQETTGANITKQSSTVTDESFDRLMDTDEIKKVTKSAMVRFEWNDLK
ncbi:hypothetical protein VMCG_04485 [Cytospora schulzeri]|uniref:Uncharacterized protein n=1 Tax=Cytospora schulzeri TaxID=448051 RepID=A0A423WRR9_9PEZI|nr:hypothetical protein VMCG_04485 [Valsa malicola]